MRLTLLFVAPLAAAPGVSLATTYSPGSVLRIETETGVETTTALEMLRDGVPVDRGADAGRGGRDSTDVRHSVVRERVVEASDGAPTTVRREFATLDAEIEAPFGDMRLECPLEGVTLELTARDGEVEVEVVDGDEPDAELLEGHLPTLDLDALLPPGPVEEEETWDLGDEAVRRLLGLDIDRVLFGRPERERAGGSRGAGGGPLGFLAGAAWTATAKLVDADQEHGGERCARVAVELESSGDLPDREDGGFGDRGPSGEPASRTGTFEVRLEGTLLFSIDAGRPVLFEVEGTFTTESRTVRERGESTIEIDSTREGTWRRRVAIASEDES